MTTEETPHQKRLREHTIRIRDVEAGTHLDERRNSEKLTADVSQRRLDAYYARQQRAKERAKKLKAKREKGRAAKT